MKKYGLIISIFFVMFMLAACSSSEAEPAANEISDTQINKEKLKYIEPCL